MHYQGSAQVGLGRRFLERYAWWLFEPIQVSDRPSFGMGIPGKVAVFYLAGQWADQKFAGVQGKRIEIEPGARYRAYFFDPRTGKDVAIGPVEHDPDGFWLVPAQAVDGRLGARYRERCLTGPTCPTGLTTMTT